MVDINDMMVSVQCLNEFILFSQFEGCVIDDIIGILYYGEELIGVWKCLLVLDVFVFMLIVKVNEQVYVDIEGMDIYCYEQQCYLIVFSQGNSCFVVYVLDDN